MNPYFFLLLDEPKCLCSELLDSSYKIKSKSGLSWNINIFMNIAKIQLTLAMELFGRRRWRLVSAQANLVITLDALSLTFLHFLITTPYHWADSSLHLCISASNLKFQFNTCPDTKVVGLAQYTAAGFQANKNTYYLKEWARLLPKTEQCERYL